MAGAPRFNMNKPYDVVLDLNKTSMHELVLGPELTKACTEIAQGAMDVMKAKALGQMGLDDYDYYVTRFRLRVVVIPDIPDRKTGEPMSRTAAQVWNDSPAAKFAEVGNSKTNTNGQNHQGHRIFATGLTWIEATHGDGNKLRRGTRDWGY